MLCALFGAGPPGAGRGAAADAATTPARAAGKTKYNIFRARMEQGIRDCVNAHRAAAGMRQLAAGLNLGRAARFHAQSMVKGGFFSHTDPRGRTPADRVAMFAGRSTFAVVGENIAAGQPGSAAACRAWMASGSHRANILRGGYTHVGGGFARGGQYKRYFVMELGRVRG